MPPKEVRDRISYHYEALKISNEESGFEDTLGLREYVEDCKRNHRRGY